MSGVVQRSAVSRRLAAVWMCLALLCGVLLTASVTFEARAQSPAAPVKAEKPLRRDFAVLHMMRTAIEVKSLTDEREIHTFTYAEPIRDRMQALFDQGGYQFGDKVRIQYMTGSEVALKISGKPSKPL